MTLTHYHHGTGSQRQAGHILAAVEQFERAAAAHDAASAAGPEHLQESAAENCCACHGAAGLHLQEPAGLHRALVPSTSRKPPLLRVAPMPVAPEKTNANAAAPLTVVALAVAPEVTCWTPEPAIVG